MRIGNLEIRHYQERRSRPDTKELGATGTIFSAGIISEAEYNTDLRGDKGIKTLDKMRRSDGMVRAILAALTLPIRSAEWYIEPASESSEDQLAAGIIEQSLFGSTQSWDDFLRHALLMLPFGWSAFEKVFELRDGVVYLRKLAPRLHPTLYKWLIDEAGGLAGLVQLVWRPGENQFQFITIPVEKLLVFSLEREGSNFEGQSILRAAYKHWWYKDQLYRIDAIAAEKHGVGTPYAVLKQGADPTAVAEALQSLHAHEKGYMILSEEDLADRENAWGIESPGGGQTIKDVIKSIEHHDIQIARSVLAEFVALGAATSGSWAMHRDKSSFFLLALQAVANHIRDTINSYCIKKLIDFNFNVTEYPRLEYRRLETRQTSELATGVASLLQVGGLTPDRDLEEALRADLGLPAMPEEIGESEKESRLSAGRKYWREMREEEQWASFAEIEEQLDQAEEQIIAAARNVQDRQIEKLLELAQNIVERGEAERVEKIDVPYKGDMASAILDILKDLYRFGRQEVLDQLERQGRAKQMQDITEDEEQILQFLLAKAKALAALLAVKLKSTFTFEVLDQIRSGRFSARNLRRLLEELSERELQHAASLTASESLALGMQNAAQENADDIERAIYTALLDQHTCDPCKGADGKEFRMNDPELESYRPPYRKCEGRNKCRCAFIYVFRRERRAEK